jgi:ATP-dependent DNA helicase RecQ
MVQRRAGVDAARLLEIARDRFGVRNFRAGQLALIEAVLRGQDALGILPTGAGKSLTYQLPALLLPKPVLVVSPLISLMQDQQDKLTELDISAASLNSTLRASEERELTAQLREGEHELIYITPERLENPAYMELLKKQGVSLFVVDEAHCVSTWGHDFRPSYLSLRDARRQLGNPPLLALTATATESMVEDILTQLAADRPRIVQLGVERKNLRLEVQRAPRAGQKRELLLSLLQQEEGSGIVYVATIKKAVELHGWLCQQGIAAELYHGRLKASERADAQHRFMADEAKVMVATNAFGLGIDKQDLRFVVHFNFPDSLETYYQEAGRAGRDGKPARAVLLYKLEDKRLQSYFLGGKYPRRDESLKIILQLRALGRGQERAQGSSLVELAKSSEISEKRTKVIVAQLEGVGIVERKRGRVFVRRDVKDEVELDALLTEYEDKRESDGSRLELMMRYAENARCRTRFLNEYFGEESEERCTHCDNCLALAGEAVHHDHRQDDEEREARLTRSAAEAQERLERLVASAVGNVQAAEIV